MLSKTCLKTTFVLIRLYIRQFGWRIGKILIANTFKSLGDFL
ncbi:hypothetical protein ACU8KH_06076 [Lachancea thermotolerans]